VFKPLRSKASGRNCPGNSRSSFKNRNLRATSSRRTGNSPALREIIGTTASGWLSGAVSTEPQHDSVFTA